MATSINRHADGMSERTKGTASSWVRVCACRIHFVFAAIALFLVTGCARDAEETVRSKLNQWFELGETAYFVSKPRCTGAVIHMAVDEPREDVVIQDGLTKAREAFRHDAVVALQIEWMTPAELVDALLLNGTGVFGTQALAAAALAVSCFEGTQAGGFLFEAFHRQGAILAYDTKGKGLIVLDGDEDRLFYVAGDIW